jgi:hypothetical protein
MAIPRNGKHKEYARYAEHCLHRTTIAKDQSDRTVLREMAAEWIKLADAVLQPPKADELIGTGPFRPLADRGGPF